MFTGIVEDIGTIVAIGKLPGRWELAVRTSLGRSAIRPGDSVAVDGVCLTATRVEGETFYADASLETLSVTTLTGKRAGDRANLERAVEAGGRLGGHIVMGHVDAIGTIVAMRREGDSVRIGVEIPREASRYVVRKGSVALDGISLTVNEQNDTTFTVNIIPFSASKTTLGSRILGDRVNVETDVLARYVEKFVASQDHSGVDLDFLYKYGYIKGK